MNETLESFFRHLGLGKDEKEDTQEQRRVACRRMQRSAFACTPVYQRKFRRPVTEPGKMRM